MSAPSNVIPLHPDGPPSAGAKPPRPRVKWLRLLLLLVPLGLLAVVSTVFGMMMAVASDLPSLENEPQYRTAAASRNSTLTDVRGYTIGRLSSDTNRVFVEYDDIAPAMRNAVISVEDERFQSNNGVDLRGIGRAFFQDIVEQRAAQGGSTITQQFVKNALEAQGDRTVFEKLRESALAYHLTRKWGKRKILQEYLNSIYFGNGAYGIEAAAKTYFGNEPDHLGCGTERRPCAKELRPVEAAFLAGIIANPTGFDPVEHYKASEARRNVVLDKMLEQGYIDQSTHDAGLAEALPGKPRPPRLDAKYNSEYFVSWVRQQLVDRYGAQRAFEGGLKVKTTLDLQLQYEAEKAVKRYLSDPAGPTASVVAIDNDTGEVRAMVSGTKPYADAPFNLATQGQRQPGSSIKPFILAQALKEGIPTTAVFPSKKQTFCVVRKKDGTCKEPFVVNNFEGTYVGQRTIANALTYSDNSVFARLGIQVGTKKVAKLVEKMGVRTPVSSNLAMTLGGLKQGVSVLDMAHAYETFQQGGRKVTGSLAARDQGPVGIAEVESGKGTRDNEVEKVPVLPESVAKQTNQVMSTVVSQGTGKRAALGEFVAGKTGTTENSGDAWFVGFTDRMTVAVWVGYPDGLKPMESEFQGGPVEGGTFPALIWHDFMVQANATLDARKAKDRQDKGLPPETGTTQSSTTPGAPAAGVTTQVDPGAIVPEGGDRSDGTAPVTPQTTPATPKVTPATPAPDPDPAPATPTPAPDPTPTPTTPATPATPGTGGAGTQQGGAGAPAAAAPTG